MQNSTNVFSLFILTRAPQANTSIGVDVSGRVLVPTKEAGLLMPLGKLEHHAPAI